MSMHERVERLLSASEDVAEAFSDGNRWWVEPDGESAAVVRWNSGAYFPASFVGQRLDACATALRIAGLEVMAADDADGPYLSVTDLTGRAP